MFSALLLVGCLFVGSAHPQRPAPFAVQGAMDSEIGPLVEALGNPTPRVVAGYSFWEGTLGGRRVVLVRTEVGMVNAAVATTLLIRDYQPELIINQGTAGAISEVLRVGDLVIGAAAVPFGAVRTASRPRGAGMDLEGWTPMPRRLRLDGERVAFERFPSDPDLVEAALRLEHRGGRVVKGVVGSGDQWNRELDKLAWARRVFGIDSEDMESAAVAQVARAFGVRFLPVRIISNSEMHDPVFHEETGAECARFVLRLLRSLAAEERRQGAARAATGCCRVPAPSAPKPDQPGRPGPRHDPAVTVPVSRTGETPLGREPTSAGVLRALSNDISTRV